MWCELAISLGYTIAELQSKMSFKELRIWLAYMRKYGPMNDVRRYDRPAAMVGQIISKVNGGKVEMKDLMPWGKEDKEVTLEEFVNSLGPGVKVGKR